MGEPENAIRFLDQLEAKDSKLKPDFRYISRYIEQKARKAGVPVSGKFELTPLCNLDCRMCFIHLAPEQLKGRSVLSVAAWKDLMQQAWNAGMYMATLTGGECLTYPGFDELFLFLRSLGCEIVVMTNGVLLNDERIRFFLEHRPADIQVTLYGWNDDVYERVTGKRAFGTVVRNITRAREAGLSVSVGVTPNAFLGEDSLETFRTAKSLSNSVVINTGLFSPREETGRAGQTYEPDPELYIRMFRLEAELNGTETREVSPDRLPAPGGPSHECTECGLQCAAGRSTFTIDWQGDLLACNHLDMIREHPLEDGFREAWKRINRKAKEWPVVPECCGCPYEHVCNHCAAQVLRYGEAGKLPVQLCERTMSLVRHGLRSLPGCE